MLFILPITPDIPAPVAMAWGQRLRKQRLGMNGKERKQGLSEKQPTQGVNVDKLGLYSPAEKASRTERDTMRQRKGQKKREG